MIGNRGDISIAFEGSYMEGDKIYILMKIQICDFIYDVEAFCKEYFEYIETSLHNRIT